MEVAKRISREIEVWRLLELQVDSYNIVVFLLSSREDQLCDSIYLVQI